MSDTSDSKYSSPTTDGRPNILLIHCHDLGQHLGCYGQDVETPRIDTLADEGVLFENHFTTAPQCSPSRGSLWTGLHPHANGLIGLEHSGWKVRESITTLPQHLAQRGYTTHLFGLQHVTDDPEAFGYTDIHSEEGLKTSTTASYHDVNRAHSVSSSVTQFLRDSPDDPFFASVGFFESHRADMGSRFGFNEDQYDCPDPDDVAALPYLPDRPEIRKDIAAINGMVRAIDSAVGQIDDALDATGLQENTLILLTTEHGIAFPRAKGTCFDPGIEGVLLGRLPGVLDGGERYDELISNVDILPTLLDLVADETPSNIAGHSVLPLVTGDDYTPRDRVFAEMTWHDRYDPVRAIRTENYKYIRTFWHRPPIYMPNDVFASRSGREVREEYYEGVRPYEQLYDLEEDPHEQNNLADDDDYAAVKDELNRRLVTWMDDTEDILLDGPVPPADFDEIQPDPASLQSTEPTHTASTDGESSTNGHSDSRVNRSESRLTKIRSQLQKLLR